MVSERWRRAMTTHTLFVMSRRARSTWRTTECGRRLPRLRRTAACSVRVSAMTAHEGYDLFGRQAVLPDPLDATVAQHPAGEAEDSKRDSSRRRPGLSSGPFEARKR